MPDTRAAATPTPLRLTPTVGDVVALLERYAAADRELADAMDRIGAEVSSSRRVSQATVSRLASLLETSLVPGVQAKAELDALPRGLRRAGIAQWAQRSAQHATTRLAAHPIEGTA
jgi:hypothetical protein